MVCVRAKTTDIPNSETKVCCLGEGTVISFMDKRTIYDREYYNMTLDLAKKSGVKVQIKKAVAGGNDAGAIQSSKEGVRTVALSLPCRYIHSELSICYKSDIESLIEMVRLLSYKIASGD